ncbi:GbsR/MarR family transcriptional regulator [Pseudooceanicola sp. C21-150M6]|uniref:GbsR/MarR family transcriptional regulator n=1 Tax=Pseudooceanicola sp. C21-150M6 TaxID=3434355 RepID=UPI003D7F4F48
MGSRWGLNRSVAQMLGLLHISPNPLTAEEISETLNLARSNVSTGLKELSAWRLIRTSRQLGDRRDYFTTPPDIMEQAEAVAAARREREVIPTLVALRDIQGRAETDETPPEVRARIAETYETMQLLDDFYSDISALPRGTQMTLLRLGTRLGAFLSDVTGPSKGSDGQEPALPKAKKKKKKVAVSE